MHTLIILKTWYRNICWGISEYVDRNGKVTNIKGDMYKI